MADVLSVKSDKCFVMVYFSYRVLYSSLWDIAAYWGILAVFECPWLDFLEVAV